MEMNENWIKTPAFVHYIQITIYFMNILMLRLLKNFKKNLLNGSLFSPSDYDNRHILQSVFWISCSQKLWQITSSKRMNYN